MALKYRGTGLSPSQVGKVFVDSADTTQDFLTNKLVTTVDLVKTILNPAGNEQLQLSLASSIKGKVFVDGADTTANFLTNKLITDSTITKTIMFPGGNEQVQLVVNTGTLNGLYVQLAPTATQTIQGTGAGTVPLNIQQDAAGLQTSVLFQVLDSVGFQILAVGANTVPNVLIGSVGGTSPIVSPTLDPLTFSDASNVQQLLIENVPPQVKVLNNLAVTGTATVTGAITTNTSLTVIHTTAGAALTVTDIGTLIGASNLLSFSSLMNFTVGANNLIITGMAVGGNMNLGAFTGLTIRGLSFAPNVLTATAGSTITEFTAIRAVPSYSTANVTVTDEFGINVLVFGGVAAPTITRATGIKVKFGATAAPATVYGLDIDAITTGTTRIGIRQSGGTGATNRISSVTRFGDQNVPVASVDAGGTAGTTMQAQGKNVLVREKLDEAQASATVPNADTTLKSYALPANNYSNVITEGEGYISTTALSTQQDVNIKIKYGAGQVGNTVIFHLDSAAAGKFPFTMKASALQAGAVTIAITIGAALADANTTVFLNSLRVYGEV